MIINKCRRSSGQALTYVIVSTLALVVLGVGFIFLMQILGGTGEQRNATDGGVLNLNKTAVGQDVILPASYLNQPGHQFIAMYGKSSGLIQNDGSMKVSLATFNNMIGSALIVAMNASADGMSGSNGGQTNAANVINDLEVSKDSVGAQLKNLLQGSSASSTDWAARAFQSVSLVNSERMMGKNSQASWDKNEYQVAYLVEPKAQSAASNVALDQFVNNNMPFVYDGSGKMSAYPTPKSILTDNGPYLRGYQAINIPNISTPIYAVPTQPGQQPHLISLKTFAASLQQPGEGKVILPPNAFKAGAASNNEISSSTQKANAAGIVGMPGSAPQANIPHGFIMIDNSMNPNMTPVAVPNGDNWEAVEGCTGTLVYRPNHIFSTESTVNGRPYNALTSWLQTPRSGNFDPNSGPPIVDDEGNALLYDAGGNPITSKAEAAKQIPFDSNPSDLVLATNQNSDPNGASPDSDCTILDTATLPDNLSPFNRAYHPNANSNGLSGNGKLISSEQAKVYVLDLLSKYHGAGSMGGSFSDKTFPMTGLRRYENGVLPSLDHPYPYAPKTAVMPSGKLPIQDYRVENYGDPYVLGKVTKDGSMLELIQQTTQSFPYMRFDGDTNHVTMVQQPSEMTPEAEIKKFLKQRMNEIHSGASDADVENVLKQTLILGSSYYVYYQNAWLVSTSPPQWVTSIPTPDGIRHAFTHTYEISGSMVDAPHDFGANDYPFQTNGVSVKAVDCVSYQSSSGANGMLGYVKFFQQAVPKK